MKIAIFGSTVLVGKILINKAIAASYEVKTPVRNPEKPALLSGYSEKVKERGNPEETNILPGEPVTTFETRVQSKAY